MNNLKNKLDKIKEEASKVAKLKESVEKNYDILKESLLLRLVEKRIDEEEALKKMNTYNCIKLLDGVVCANIKSKRLRKKKTIERCSILFKITVVKMLFPLYILCTM